MRQTERQKHLSVVRRRLPGVLWYPLTVLIFLYGSNAPPAQTGSFLSENVVLSVLCIIKNKSCRFHKDPEQPSLVFQSKPKQLEYNLTPSTSSFWRSEFWEKGLLGGQRTTGTDLLGRGTGQKLNRKGETTMRIVDHNRREDPWWSSLLHNKYFGVDELTALRGLYVLKYLY